MYSHFNNQFHREILTLHPGEYFATKEDLVLSTVLGSCVAVALFDGDRGLGGLNHFMLPTSRKTEHRYEIESGKYGMYAMELLINSLLKLGARRESLQAKEFGGASVLSTTVSSFSNVSRNNIEFAFDYLKAEGIPVVSQDVGGTAARKIFFYPRTARVLLKRLSGKFIPSVQREEEEYLQNLEKKKKAANEGDLTLF